MSSNMRLTRICEHCNNEFIAKTSVTKYCGDNCAKRAYKERQRLEKITASNSQTQEKKAIPVIDVKTKEFLTVKDAAILLNCSIRTAYRLIEGGSIKAVNLSQRKTLIKRSDIDQLFV